MKEFVRFPRTPHLAWLSGGVPRGDKVLSPNEAEVLLSREVTVEEKLDGANLGILIDKDGRLRLQNRGQYLSPPFRGQFSRATSWVDSHAQDLVAGLGQELILFGEWCAARHSVAYNRLPDWFLAFDVYDRSAHGFWSTRRRNAWADRLGVLNVPILKRGRMTLADLKDLMLTQGSRFGSAKVEGIIIRRECDNFLEQRAKLVRPDFIQSIGTHWQRQQIQWNAVASG